MSVTLVFSSTKNVISIDGKPYMLPLYPVWDDVAETLSVLEFKGDTQPIVQPSGTSLFVDGGGTPLAATYADLKTLVTNHFFTSASGGGGGTSVPFVPVVTTASVNLLPNGSDFIYVSPAIPCYKIRVITLSITGGTGDGVITHPILYQRTDSHKTLLLDVGGYNDKDYFIEGLTSTDDVGFNINASIDPDDTPVLILEVYSLPTDGGGGGGGSVGGSYNTITQHSLGDGDTLTLPANTIHALSFSVIAGTLDVSMDGGSSGITYPAGYNSNVEASGTFNTGIEFVASGGQTIIQTITI